MIIKFFQVAIPLTIMFGVLICLMTLNGLFWGGAFIWGNGLGGAKMRVVLVCPGWLLVAVFALGDALGGANMRVMLVCPGWLQVGCACRGKVRLQAS